jgi:flagellar protein FliS
MPLRLREQETIMNASIAINAYSTIKKQTVSSQEVGYNVISSALHKLDANLSILIFNKDSKETSKAYERSLLTIYFLQKSLDFNSGSDLAKNLFRLYEFCRTTLLEKGISGSHDDSDLKKCHSFINEIMKSWDTLKTP